MTANAPGGTPHPATPDPTNRAATSTGVSGSSTTRPTSGHSTRSVRHHDLQRPRPARCRRAGPRGRHDRRRTVPGPGDSHRRQPQRDQHRRGQRPVLRPGQPAPTVREHLRPRLRAPVPRRRGHCDRTTRGTGRSTRACVAEALALHLVVAGRTVLVAHDLVDDEILAGNGFDDAAYDELDHECLYRPELGGFETTPSSRTTSVSRTCGSTPGSTNSLHAGGRVHPISSTVRHHTWTTAPGEPGPPFPSS